MEREIIIHLEWEGPTPLKAVSALKEPSDYGVYQIYGAHPVYGSSCLLYIGLAVSQHFGARITQEREWLYNHDAGRMEVYVGRLAGSVAPDDATWERHIELAERLLIYAHSPAMNIRRNLASLATELQNVHVLNWGRHRDLLPEVSGARWSDRFNDFPNYHAFRDDEPREAGMGK